MLRQLILLYFFLLLTSCSLVTYQQAQSHFSAAARQTNAELMGLDTEEIAAGLGEMYRGEAQPAPGEVRPTARAQYEQAREKLQKALKKEEQLRVDGVLGNVRTLLALTEWQLNEMEAARDQARLARTVFAANPEDNEGGRDLAMAYAIDGLITVNEVYDSIRLLLDLPPVSPADSAETTRTLADFAERRILAETGGSLAGALAELDGAVEKVTRSRPTVAYLRSAQMAALQNWRALHNALSTAGRNSLTFSRDPDLAAAFDLAEEKMNDTIERYRLKLAAAAPGGENDPLYRFWKGRVFR